MEKVRLGDVCIKESSNIAQKDLENSEGEFPVYGASGFIKNVDFYKQNKTYIAVVKDGASVGRIMKCPAKSSVIGTMQYIIPKDNVDIDFLAFAMENMNLAKYYTGATIPHIYFKDYCREAILLPPLEEQKKLSDNLNKLTYIINKRKEQLQKMDELVKSRFIEMFGSPILNDKGFPTICGKDYFKLSNGKAVPEDKRMASGIPAYGGNGVSWYTGESLCSIDTLVVGRVGFQSGNVHLAKGPLWITDNAMYISDFYVKDYNLVFLCALMEHIDFTKYQDAGDLKKITQKPFMKMVFIDPPRELQKQYAAFVEQTDKSKFEIQKSLEKLELLKKALMQKYFG